MDRLAFLDILADYLDDSGELILSGGYLSVYLGLELPQLIRYGGVQYQHGGGAVRGGTYGTELETITGEGERGGTVTIRVIDQ
jgi:hypothetical protein